MGRNSRSILFITIAGLAFGVSYPIFAREFDQPVAIINGISIGGVGGFLMAIFEVYVLNPKNRNYSFPVTVIVKTVFYTVLFFFLIIFIKGFVESMAVGQPFLEYIRSDTFQNFLWKEDFDVILIYSLMMVGLIIFSRQMSRKIGPGVLFSFITGRSHEPIEETRIFMFLDLKSSTTIAEKMGAVRYYQLLNDFFFDMTKSIEEGRGTIYRYVGDQVVLTWRMRDPGQNAWCVKTYFNIKRTFGNLKEKYYEKYGFVPEFRAAIHCGKVIRGEIGDIKSQIVFHGEPLFMTGKIEKLCGKLNQELLLSESLKSQMKLPSLLCFQKVPYTVENHSDDLPFTLHTVAEKETV